ncbi:5' nucleotidase, NT5C type [Kangiella shandongensis]|uniref:5' nucleotidase, NT5C type n=1 Tax=Kangiella shandongensis TaxID=2763258 RepID=UPI001CBE78B4|nr:hypothetical protein [Kangiella shandongensis]
MIIYIDMDGVLADYDKAFAEVKNHQPNVAYPQSLPQFFENLEPIDGAIDAFNALSQEHDVYILTAPSNRNPLSYTEKRLWVENHLGFEATERLIICSNKGLLKGGILIDDNIDGKGQESFEGQVLHFGSKQLSKWSDIIQKITVMHL